MPIHESEFDSDSLYEVPSGDPDLSPDACRRRGACEIRRLLERRSELKRLRDLLDEPGLADFE